MAVVIFLCCLLGGIAIGLPIAWSLLLCGAALMTYLDMFDVQIMAQTLVNGADSFSLLAIPFFVLAGEIMNAGGLSKRIVDLPMKLVGHKPGGLGYVGVIAAMIMARLCTAARWSARLRSTPQPAPCKAPSTPRRPRLTPPRSPRCSCR